MGANGVISAIHKAAKAPNIKLVFVRWGGLGAGGTTSTTQKEPNINPVFVRWRGLGTNWTTGARHKGARNI